jgi:membrane associated rhomboid family serine protease
LIGNVYFLLIFGDNVEDDLGPWRWLLLLTTATVAGGLLHTMLMPHSEIPCIGASGGISGIITYYALRFPHARLGIMFRYWWYFRWLNISAFGALLLWFGLQLLIAFYVHLGLSNVGVLAHLGGAAAGAIAFLLQSNGGERSHEVI